MKPQTIVVPADVKFASGVVMRPGDKLLIAFNHRLNMAQADMIKQRWRDMVPEAEIVILDDIAAMAVYRPDEQNI